MKALVVYETYYGNTEKVAFAVARALGGGKEVNVVKCADYHPDMLHGIEQLVVGSPTRGFHHTEGIQKFLKDLPDGSLDGLRVASFDTRSDLSDVNVAFQFLMKKFGYAAEPVAKTLEQKGGKLTLQPEGFYIKDVQGPLKDGELDRAGRWAAKMLD
jgi:flavodoxin